MNQHELMRIILSPHISEKATLAKQYNQYVFRVVKHASKKEVKSAVELLFKTPVESVRIVNVKSKPKRFGQIQGKSKPWKKAYVKLAAGQNIDFGGA